MELYIWWETVLENIMDSSLGRPDRFNCSKSAVKISLEHELRIYVHFHRVRSSTIPQDRPLPSDQIFHYPSRSSTFTGRLLSPSQIVHYALRSSTFTRSDWPLSLKTVHFRVTLTTNWDSFKHSLCVSSILYTQILAVRVLILPILYQNYSKQRKCPNEDDHK